MASQWLLYSTVNLTLSNKLEISQHNRWAQLTTQFHVTNCIITRVKSNNIGIEIAEKPLKQGILTLTQGDALCMVHCDIATHRSLFGLIRN